MAERFMQLFEWLRSRPRRKAEMILGRPITTLVYVGRFSALRKAAAIALVVGGAIAVYFLPLWIALAGGLPLAAAFDVLQGVLVEADDGSLWLIRRWSRRAEPARVSRPNPQWWDFDTAVVINERQWCWHEPQGLERHLEPDPPARTTTPTRKQLRPRPRP